MPELIIKVEQTIETPSFAISFNNTTKKYEGTVNDNHHMGTPSSFDISEATMVSLKSDIEKGTNILSVADKVDLEDK